MIVQIFAIYDTKAESYLQPFFSQTRGAAIRAFTDSVNDTTGESQFAKHPEDYTLFHLGHYDDQTSVITQNSTPQSLGVAIEFKKTYPTPATAG